MAYIGATPGLTILSINDLLDVNTDSPNDRDLLVFDSSTGEYIGRQLTTTDVGEGSNLYYTRLRFDSDITDTATIAAIRSYFSAGGDLIYDSNTGTFSFDVEQVYTQANFDSDFNTSLDAAALGGVGLTYDSANNTLSISDTGVSAGNYGSASSIPVISVNAQGQIDSIGTVSVAGVSGVEYDSSNGIFTVTTSAGTTFSDSITLGPFTTSDLTEGSNLYYTTARADSDVANYLATNSYATQTYVDNSINAVLDNAPAALDTLNELAAAINDDSNFAGTVTASLATKLNISNFDSSFDTRLATKSTSNLSEGNNLYYTTGRFDSDFGNKIAAIDGDLIPATDGTYKLGDSNHKWSELHVSGNTIYLGGVVLKDSASTFAVQDISGSPVSISLGNNTTTDLQEGSNLYYTTARADSDFDARLATKSTTDVSEGTNKYYTDERVDDRVSSLLVGGAGINILYSDSNNQLEIRIDSAPEVGYDLSANTTDDLSEGISNRYYTKARVDSDIVQGFADRTTSNLEEGSNLYYTTARADSDIASYLSDNSFATQTYVDNSISAVLDNAPAALDTLNELAAAINDDSNFAGTVTASLSTKLNIANFDSSFDTRLATKSTSNLSEGNNLYYTKARVDSDIEQGFNDRTTTALEEGNNLYYTRGRFDSALGDSLSTQTIRDLFSSSGDLSYSPTTGQFSIDVELAYTANNFDSDLDAAISGGVGLNYNPTNNTVNIDSAELTAYFSTNNITEGDNLYYTTARVDSDFDARLSTKSTSNLSEGNNLYYTKVRVDSDVNQGFTSRTTDALDEGSTNLYYTSARADSDARHSISVTDAGGDGSLTYSATTGVLTYTGPSASEVRAHFSAGTGVTLSSGQISIGQAVGTTDSVTFAGLNVTGNVVVDGDLQINGTTTTVSTQNLEVTDNMIYMNAGESSGSPTQFIDVGFAANYNDIGSYAHTGFFRDATDGVWKLYQGYTPEPDSDLDIDVNHASFEYANLRVANITANNITGIYAGFDSDFSTKTTSDLDEGNNLYYTQARFDSDFNVALDASALNGTGLSYNSTTNTLSITNTGVISGTYGSTSAIPVLSINAQGQIDSIGTVSVAGVTGVEFDSATGRFTVSTGAGTSFNDVITLDPFSTSGLSEGSNLYYTTARADSDFDNRLATKTTSNLSEGNNLYYTKARVDSDVAQGFSDRTTDNLSEGTANLYYTTARADSDISSYLSTNSYATETYVTNSISAVLDGAPAALDTLNELAAAINDDSNFAGTVTASLATKLNIANFDSSFDTRLSTKSTSNLSEGDNLYYTKARVDSDVDQGFSDRSTDNLSEGTTNLYYTTTRADSDFDARLDTKNTGDLSEGVNLYYTTARADSDFDIRLDTKTTDDLSEGTVNIYYTTARHDSDFAVSLDAATTDDLSEGTVNLYYTNGRFDSDFGEKSVGALSDVSLSGITDGQILAWDSATSAFAPSDVAATGLEEQSYTSSTLAQQVVDSWAVTEYRGGEYLIAVTADFEFNMSKVLVVHDTINAYMTQYGEIGTDVGGNGSFDVRIQDGNFELLYTPSNAASTVKFTRNLLSNSGTYVEFPEDLMSGSRTIDLMSDGSPTDLAN